MINYRDRDRDPDHDPDHDRDHDHDHDPDRDRDRDHDPDRDRDRDPDHDPDSDQPANANAAFIVASVAPRTSPSARRSENHVQQSRGHLGKARPRRILQTSQLQRIARRRQSKPHPL